MRRPFGPLLWLAVLAVVVFGVTPQVLLWRARVLRREFEATSRRTGKPIEDSLPAVLAQIAAHSPWAKAAHREEARFWIAMARSGERFEPKLGPTRRLANRINRAYSEAIRADAGWAAPLAVRRLIARSRFDLAGRKRGAALERALAPELRLARTLSGLAPAPCEDGLDGARRRFAPGVLGPGGPAPWSRANAALSLAAQGHDDRALALLERAGGDPIARAARGLVLLRAGHSTEAERELAAVSSPEAAIRDVIRTARALARAGAGRPDDALFVIGPEPQGGAFAAVRVVSGFVTGDNAGARAALRRILDGSALEPLRRELEPALVDWSQGRRAEGRAIVAAVVARRPDDWDFLLPFGRFAAGHLDDLDAWIEQAAPRDPLARVWQLYALERAARERDNDARAGELATLRRRICR